MSLYDGIDIDDKSSNSTNIAGWGSSMKLLETQKQLQEKKQMLQNVIKRKPMNASFTALAPVVDLKSRKKEEEGNLRFNQATGKMERVTMPQITPLFIGSDAGQNFLGVIDEYDPMRPNDYENFLREKRRKKRLKDKEEEEEKRKRQSDEENDEDGRLDSRRNRRNEETLFGEDREERKRRRHRPEEDDGREEEKNRLAATRAAIAPPPSLMEMDIKPPDKLPNLKTEAPGKFGQGASVASKIMARMGYREGQGLGKSEQGMSIALQVEKTSRRGGKIIHERDLHKSQDMTVPRVETSNANLLRNPSKVICLRNMVGPGEVDAALEGEVSEECSKYGKVMKCTIFEIPDNPEEEAVRIFLEFERLEQSIKAVVDLNGRFFGGRIVKGNFYNLDKFRRLNLGDEID